MTVTIKNIIPRKEAESSQTAQYTAIGCKTIIDKFTATNHASVDVDISVYLVAASDFAGVNNQVLRRRTIAPLECYLCPELVGQVIEEGGYISTLASLAGAITISASGREIN